MAQLVLITRPEEQAKELAEQLQSLGYSTLRQPLLNIEYYPFSFEKQTKPKAIILSSTHAVHNRKAPADWCHIPVFCVGAMTEKSAHLAGFQNIISGDADVNAVFPLITREIEAGSHLLYLRGQNISQEIKAALPQYKIEEILTYNAIATSDFSPDVVSKFTEIDIITLFSARSGAVLRQLIEKNSLIPHIKNINLLCLSFSVVESLGEMNWKSVYVSDKPNQPSLIEKLKSI